MSDSPRESDDNKFLDELEAQFKVSQEAEERDQPTESAAEEPDAIEITMVDDSQATATDDRSDPATEADEAAEPELAAAQAVAETVEPAHDPHADDEAEHFESPEQVLGEDMIDQLQKMLDQVNADKDPLADAESEAADDPVAAASDDDLDKTAAEAESVSDEMSDLATQIDGAMKSAAQMAPQDEPAADDAYVDAHAIQQMISGKPAADVPAREESPAPEQATRKVKSEAIGQIDEYLAGQADSAVEGEFETVHDVMAAEQARDAAVAVAAEQEESNETDDAAAHAEADSSEAEQDAEETEAVAVAVAAAPQDQPREAVGSTAAAPVTSKRSADVDAGGKPSLRDRLGRIVRAAGKTSAATLFTVCSIVNTPLTGKSETTRKLIGYAAIITLANASLLLVGKYVLGIFG